LDIKKCDLIMIQDKNRAAVLDNILNSHAIPKYYLPVSLGADLFSSSEAKRRGSVVLTEKITLMQSGSIALGRNSHVIINAYQKLPDNILLILKGLISDDIRILVEKADRKPGVYPRSATYKEMREFIDQADIGIIACEAKNRNNYFISMASGQLVEYLRLGIPVIVLDMGEFVERNKCGLLISNEIQLKNAIQQIAQNYCDYSRAALSVFKKFYDLGLYRDSLITNLLLKQ
jgi:glycosyltransferase involved in cell wall biosynthesis